ncbi:hypothetical protein FHU33_1753 [Blastococcus colisei]|uniref:Uncharacterized protein n=1 Tax=Blastococcus colisei TaxID=1564162 RepID=A0A543PE46_9ACTN|nr:hypothetical protein [Blastococcus colisei]TQN42355.1 hypothetical protein FHU33_1753 [Blastococcus colisei]
METPATGAPGTFTATEEKDGSPSDEESGESSVERWVRLATSVIAPTTVLTALLFYFGYVATTAEYRYFGITLGTLGLSTQDVVLRSVAALYVPIGGALVLLLLVTWLHQTVSRWLAAWTHITLLRRMAIVLVVIGMAAFARGVIGIVVPEVSSTEPVAVSPLSLGLGVIAVAYGRYLLQRTATERRNSRETRWSRRAAVAFTAGLVTLSLFWATNSFAAAYGRGRAVYVAERLTNLPAVTLDTTERLFAGPKIEETSLSPWEEGQRFRYRYHGFRLLLEAEGRMFLLPEQWEVGNGTTLVLQAGDDVRVYLYRG